MQLSPPALFLVYCGINPREKRQRQDEELFRQEREGEREREREREVQTSLHSPASICRGYGGSASRAASGRRSLLPRRLAPELLRYFELPVKVHVSKNRRKSSYGAETDGDGTHACGLQTFLRSSVPGTLSPPLPRSRQPCSTNSLSMSCPRSPSDVSGRFPAGLRRLTAAPRLLTPRR